METKKIIDIDDLNSGFEIKEDIKKINVAVDGNTIVINEQGKLTAPQVPVQHINTIQAVKPSQFIKQINDFAFIELEETPEMATGIGDYKINEVSGYRDIQVTGLGDNLINLNSQTSAVVFHNRKENIGIVDAYCDIFYIDENTQNERLLFGFDMPFFEFRKELKVFSVSNSTNPVYDPNGDKTAFWFNGLLRTHGLPKDKVVNFRMYYRIRVMTKK